MSSGLFALCLRSIEQRSASPNVRFEAHYGLKSDIAPRPTSAPLSEVAAPIRLFRRSGRTMWDGSRLITDRAAFWCAAPHRMVSETEELDRWSPQSHRPSLAGQNLSYSSQPSGLALLSKASMFQPLLPFDCWATALSGRPPNRLAGRLSPACPIAPDPDACGR